jgi:hypothetical protein
MYPDDIRPPGRPYQKHCKSRPEKPRKINATKRENQGGFWFTQKTAPVRLFRTRCFAANWSIQIWIERKDDAGE